MPSQRVPGITNLLLHCSVVREVTQRPRRVLLDASGAAASPLDERRGAAGRRAAVVCVWRHGSRNTRSSSGRAARWNLSASPLSSGPASASRSC